MGFTRSTTDISVHQKLGDYPNQDNGLTAEELKKKFDYPAETLQNDLNNLEKELENVGCASKLGAIPIDENDESEANIQAKLEKIYEDLKKVVLSQIPDGSITKEKLATEYENSLAKKEELGLLYLSSKYNETNCENQKESDYTSPSLTSSNNQGYIINAPYTYYTIDDIYTLMGGNGTQKIGTSKSIEIFITFPIYVKLNKYYIKGENLYIEMYGSLNGVDYTKIYSSTSAQNGTYVINNENYYKFLKILWGNYNNGTASIYNSMKFYGKSIETLDETLQTTPSLTSDDRQGYTITEVGSVTYNGVKDIYTMMGGNDTSSANLFRDGGFLIEFPNYFKMTSIKLRGDESNHIRISGSNDGESFTDIKYIILNSDSTHNVSISNTNYYKYYKIVRYQGSGKQVIYASMYFRGYFLNELEGNKLSITKKYSNEEFEEYIKGMTVRILTPNNYINGTNLTSLLSIYGKDYIKIPSDLEKDKYYTLVYDGKKFVHESEVQNG